MRGLEMTLLNANLQSLYEAYAILREARLNAASGPMAPWRTITNAQAYIDAQVKSELSADQTSQSA
jgi:hypothetical protein